MPTPTFPIPPKRPTHPISPLRLLLTAASIYALFQIHELRHKQDRQFAALRGDVQTKASHEEVTQAAGQVNQRVQTLSQAEAEHQSAVQGQLDTLTTRLSRSEAAMRQATIAANISRIAPPKGIDAYTDQHGIQEWLLPKAMHGGVSVRPLRKENGSYVVYSPTDQAECLISATGQWQGCEAK